MQAQTRLALLFSITMQVNLLLNDVINKMTWYHNKSTSLPDNKGLMTQALDKKKVTTSSHLGLKNHLNQQLRFSVF